MTQRINETKSTHTKVQVTNGGNAMSKSSKIQKSNSEVEVNNGGNEMTHLIKLQNKETNLNNSKTEKGIKGKLGVAYQQYCIEIFRYILEEYPERNTYYTLAREIGKSKRTVMRLIDTINAIYPCIRAHMDEITNKVYLSVDDTLHDERTFQNNFKYRQNAPHLFIFLQSFFIRKMSIDEIMNDFVFLTKRQTPRNPENLKQAKKLAACKIIREIFATTYLVDYEVINGTLYIGNIIFFMD